MDPLGAATAASLQGIKHFQDFKKADYRPLKRRCQVPFLEHNKMERLSNGPHTGSTSQLPSGDKTFLQFNFRGRNRPFKYLWNQPDKT